MAMTTCEREIVLAAYCYHPKSRALAVIAMDSSAHSAAEFLAAVARLKWRKLIKGDAYEVRITDAGIAALGDE